MNQQRLFVFISLAISSVLGTFDNIGFVRDIGSNICRYTDFCYTSHKHTLTDDDLMPCCLPCDCSDDCWTAGNCCPDKVIKDVQTQKLNCKQALVKPDKMYADFMFDGFSLGIPRYRIVDSCPSDETNTSLIDGCQMIKKSVAEYTWVSDESGKIFQNRLCAYCNKALHFTEWSIRTRYPVVLLSNFSTLQQNIQSDDCDLLVEVPESERQVTDQYRCIIPKITTCNTTGLLLNRDNDIEHACSKYDSPVIVQHSVQYTIYKSIYCLVCNGFDETLETELCRSLKDVYKGPIHGIQFSALVDFERREENENRAAESECKIDEVYDTEKVSMDIFIISRKHKILI